MSRRRCRMCYVTISEKLTAKSKIKKIKPKNVWSSISICSTKPKGPLPHNHRECGNQTYLGLLISHTETSVCQSIAFQNGRFVMSILRIKPVSSCGGFNPFSPIPQSFPLQKLYHLNTHPFVQPLYSPH